MGILDNIRSKIIGVASSNYRQLRSENEELKKALVMQVPFSQRKLVGTISGGETIQILPRSYDHMYYQVLNNATARPMINSLRNEIFRNGLEVPSLFDSRCTSCGTDYDYKLRACESCGSTNIIGPSVSDRELLERFIEEPVNTNHQRLMDVLKECELDLEIVDDMWVIVQLSYSHAKGLILQRQIEEIWRAHPGNMAWSIDATGRIGQHEYTCIDHRDVRSTTDGMCSICGSILHPVVAVQFRPGTQDIIMRYIRGEVIHESKYAPTAHYGYPPALTLWQLLILTNAQEQYMATYYREKKAPNSMLGIPTKNPTMLKTFMEEMKEKLRKDPHEIPYFAYDPESKNAPLQVKFDLTPAEMQFQAVRDEARQRMAAFYGVSPIFQADVSQGGGLNNEGLQITVTNRAVSYGQEVLNRVLQQICQLIGVTDYTIRFRPSEEQDEVAELDLKLKKAQHAQMMQNLGFKVSLTGDMEFSFEEDTESKEMDSFFAELEGAMRTKPFQGAPLQKADHYSFTQNYPDWEWKQDYDFVKFEDIGITELKVHPDFEIKEEDVKNGSPRVRPKTLEFYTTQTSMDPLVVDQNLNLLDGHHRLYALRQKGQDMIKVAVVRPRVVNKGERLKAPPGGVTIRGKFYKGGMFIPKNVVENLSKKEKKKLEDPDEDKKSEETSSVQSLQDRAKQLIHYLETQPEKLEKMSADEVRTILDNVEVLDKSTPTELNRYAKILYTKGIYSDSDNPPKLFSKPVIINSALFHGTSFKGEKLRSILNSKIGLSRDDILKLGKGSIGVYVTTNLNAARYYGEVIFEIDHKISDEHNFYIDRDPFWENAGEFISQQDWDQFYSRKPIPAEFILSIRVLRSRLGGDKDYKIDGEYYILSTDQLISLLT